MANDEQKGKTEDSGDLGLNAHHEDQLIQFLRFSRYQRAERLRSVIGVFADTKKTRLTTDVAYTREEVERLLTNLETVLVADIESELINASHTSLLLYRQLCAQAEHWHLRLFANLSELENRQLLDAVHVYERQQFADMAAKKNNRPQITTGVLRRLEPIENYAGAAPLLQTEIDRLRDENERMRKRIKTIESGALDVIAEKTELQQKLAVAAANTIVVVEREPTPTMVDQQQLHEQMERMSAEMAADKLSAIKLEDELIAANRRLLEVKSHLEMKEAELEKKFSQTQAYRNMKLILNKKNHLIKQLRSQLPPSSGDQQLLPSDNDQSDE